GEVGQLRFQAGLLLLDEALADVTEGAGPLERAVLEDALARLKTQVEAAEGGVLVLQLVDHAQRLRIVFEAAPGTHAGVEGVLPGVAEGRVAEVVRQGDSLRQVLVQRQRAGHGAGDLRHLQRVGQARAEQVAFMVDEDLGLVLEAAERGRVHDAVAVALVFAAVIGPRLGEAAAARVLVTRGVGGQLAHRSTAGRGQAAAGRRRPGRSPARSIADAARALMPACRNAPRSAPGPADRSRR